MNLDDYSRLPLGEFGTPGPLRDRLVAAIVAGTKTATSSLFDEYRLTHSPLPTIGDREVVIDSEGNKVCVIQNTNVTMYPFSSVPLEHVIAEGEGFTTLEEWTKAHIEFWTSDEMTALLPEPITITPGTLVVCESFKVTATF